MRTFKIAFPNYFKLVSVSLIFIVWMAVSFIGLAWDSQHGHKLALYFMTMPMFGAVAVIIIAIFFKKHLSVYKTIELHQDRIIIQKHAPCEILFRNISDYESTLFRGTKGIIVKQIDSKKFSLIGGANSQANLSFIEAFNEKIEQLILSGELKLTRTDYNPIFESKWGLVALVCYSIFVFIIFRYFSNTSYFRLIIAINCFIAFIVLISCLAIKERNASSKWYQRQETSV